MMNINKSEYLRAIDELENEYEAFYMSTRYGEGTHDEQFKLLSTLKGDKVKNALGWIHDLYDCYYRSEMKDDTNNPFEYLRQCVNDECSSREG